MHLLRNLEILQLVNLMNPECQVYETTRHVHHEKVIFNTDKKGMTSSDFACVT